MSPARLARRDTSSCLVLATCAFAAIASIVASPSIARATPPDPAAARASAAPAAAPAAPRGDAPGPDRTAPRLRPTTETARACSFVAPVCVHTLDRVPSWAARHVLLAAESAFSAYRALSLPMPLPDATRGGTPAYDLYLDPSVTSPLTIPDPEMEPRTTDATAAYTFFPAPSTWGCDVAFDVAQEIARAMIYRFDAGAERGMVSAAATYLASIVAPCAARETPAIDAFQAAPYRAITEEPEGPASGAMLFPMYIEENEGTFGPGRLLFSLFAIASQKSDPSALHFQNEPDVFDALRSSMRFRSRSLDELLLGFSVDRAFVGDRSDGAHLPATDLYGAAGRVFFEWSIPFKTLPRRLAPLHPLSPTGAAYLWLDLADAPKDTEVTFVADWELPSVVRWSLVKIDKDGAETGRIDVAGIFGATHVERTLVLREELAGIAIVGVNAGGLDRTEPFDPDLAPFLPHAYEITLYGPLPNKVGAPFVTDMGSATPSAAPFKIPPLPPR
ncbi:MAG: hypothetical protein U0441_00650 [Polyangiaceae bacterium]